MVTQQSRNLALFTHLGADELVLQSMSGHEELGRPFEFRIVALSENFNLSLNSLLGEAIHIKVEAHGEADRFFHGIVSRFSQLTAEGKYAPL